MASSDSAAMPEVATEGIVVVDLVESTLTSNLLAGMRLAAKPFGICGR